MYWDGPGWQTVYALTRVLFLCLFLELRSNEENKHQNNTRVGAETVHHNSTPKSLINILRLLLILAYHSTQYEAYSRQYYN